MALATLDRRAPKLFHQGPTARTRLLVCAVAAVVLMLADARLKFTPPLRTALASVLAPVQRALLAPVDSYENLADRLRQAETAMAAEEAARKQLSQQALMLARTHTLLQENASLRALLQLREGLQADTLAADVLYQQRDAFARRVVIDRGSRDGLKPGAPVIDERGVLGQVQRVHAGSSEVLLISDRDASIPVRNQRTGALHIAYGGQQPWGLELRFVAANADIREGDVLRTSGLDGVYPPGLAVARVAEVERRGSTSFARVAAQPYAVADRARQVLVVKPFAAVDSARREAQPEATP